MAAGADACAAFIFDTSALGFAADAAIGAAGAGVEALAGAAGAAVSD